MKGIVKWYSKIKGYGFVGVENSKDVFIHHRNLPEELYLTEGDTIEFDIETTEKGLSAVNVRVIL